MGDTVKRNTILTLSALAAAAAVSAVTIPALAGGGSGHRGPAAAFGMMDGERGFGMRMRHGGHGPGGMRAMTGHPIYQSFDADGDGTVTAAEAEAGLAALHAEYDADGDGSLSPEEFEALFAEVTRGFAGRPFAMLDADGDGQISADEMAFPAQMMERKRMMHVNEEDATNQ
jgi:hypothetical protein